jgi:hypothetical protein
VDPELAVLGQVQSELELQSKLALLAEAEIPCIVRTAQVPGYDGVFEVYAGCYATLLVHATDRYRATRVLDEELELPADNRYPAEAAPVVPATTRQQWAMATGSALYAVLMLLALPLVLLWTVLVQLRGLLAPRVYPGPAEHRIEMK